MKHRLQFILMPIASLVLIFLPLNSNAHNTGASWETTVGGLKVDVGYDPTTFAAGQSHRFDFNALDIQTGDSVDFSDVWVRISQGEQTVFASGIHRPQFGLAGMIFVFPKAGNYDLNVRFENVDENFVEAVFPIIVGGAQDVPGSAKGPAASWKIITSALVGLLTGAIATWVVMKNLKAK